MDLDDELRQLFTGDHLDVAVKPNAEQIIVSGARSVRRRRIITATASGALVVVLAVIAGVVLAGDNPDAMPPAVHYPSTTPLPPSTVTSVVTVTSPVPAVGDASSSGATTTKTRQPSSSASTTDGVPPLLHYQILGPKGFGAIRLSDTLDDVQKSGMLGPMISDGGPGGCSTYALAGGVPGTVLISTTVRSIAANPVRTPEGVGPGWTIDQVRAVYPTLELDAAQDTGSVRVPGFESALYRLGFVDGKVTDMSLQWADLGCGG